MQPRRDFFFLIPDCRFLLTVTHFGNADFLFDLRADGKWKDAVSLDGI